MYYLFGTKCFLGINVLGILGWHKSVAKKEEKTHEKWCLEKMYHIFLD